MIYRYSSLRSPLKDFLATQLQGTRRPALNSGFMKTILLRRVGSTIEAGRLTAQQMLGADAEGAEEVDWESCSRVLDSASQLEALRKGW